MMVDGSIAFGGMTDASRISSSNDVNIEPVGSSCNDDEDTFLGLFGHPSSLKPITHTLRNFHTVQLQHVFKDVLKEVSSSFPNLVITTDSSNSTALHTTSVQGHVAVINLLLNADSNPAKIATNNGQTMIHTTRRIEEELSPKMVSETSSTSLSLSSPDTSSLNGERADSIIDTGFLILMHRRLRQKDESTLGEFIFVSSTRFYPGEVYQEINRESVDPNVVKEGGFVLGVLEDMIRVGQAMGVTVGSSGGILCVWEANVFKKDYATISDNFVAIYGTWLPSNSKILFVDIYDPQQASCKRVLWEHVSTLIGRWNGETIILGDFNEVRSIDERRGSCFNPSSARVFDHFISSSGLVDVKLEGYAFTWPHPSGSKMSKLDRFLVSEGIFSIFPSITALFLDRHLSDHRPILLHEMEAKDSFQKYKIKWAIEGDENSKFFYGIIDKKHSQLAIRGVFDNGLWCTDPVDEGLFKGVHLQGSISISHIFYADDAMFIGEWSDAKLKGVMVGECMSRHQARDNTMLKLRSRLSNWKVKTLSIGGRLTLLKSVLGASPLYNMSIFKVPKGILKSMEAIRSNFFNGIDYTVKKITWAAWDKILASKKNGGLGVSSFHALNRALLLKWVWRFISQDGSLWFHIIQALYGPSIVSHPTSCAGWFRTSTNGRLLNSLMESVSLPQSHDRWFSDLTGDGELWVKEMRVSPDHYSPDMSIVRVGLAGSYVLFGLAELVFFYSSFV
nr:RNA-directed DNA polymerase, eukaryota [Tanacetum cinerariifolium]